MFCEALVVYIKFDGEQTMWDNMIDTKHPDFTKLPHSVNLLRDRINASFEHIIPLTFRYLYATREFDFIGVFQKETDQPFLLDLIRKYAEKEQIRILKIGSCFGEVRYDERLDDAKEIVHKMWGKAVLGSVKH